MKKVFSLFIMLYYYFSGHLMAHEFHITPEQSSSINETIQKMKKGDKLIFASGTYQLKKPIGIQRKSFLEFYAEKDVYIILNENAIIFYIYNSDNLTFKGFHAKHVMPYYSKHCTSGVMDILYSHDIFMDHIEFNGSGIVGVQIRDSGSITIQSSYLHHNTISAIEIKGDVDNILIQNNTIENNPEFIKSTISLDKLKDQLIIKNNIIR
ncbi:MAG: right-handed parallel beta-helix repeat-containing protein [Spirochaetia bacterium]|nr:right-handed parallel beta-helix repeat-containing protein [Spirochaetia bacterium]